MQKISDMVVSGFFLMFGLGTLYFATRITELPSLEDPIGARGFAYGIGGMVALLSGVLLAQQYRGYRSGGKSTEVIASGKADDPRYPASTRRSMLMVLAAFLHALAMPRIGFLLSCWGFVFAGAVIMEVSRPKRRFVYPILYSIGLYLVFDTLLGVRLPPGILEPILQWIGLE